MAISDLEPGDEVVIYRRPGGQLDEDSMRVGLVKGLSHGFLQISYDYYDNPALKLVGLFYIERVAGHPHLYRQQYGLGGWRDHIYFAELDEELL